METRLLPETTSASLINAVHCADLFDLCERVYRAGVRVDLALFDPPYGTTACSWDSIIPFEPMWYWLKRIVKPRGAIVITASQPFTSALVMSNPKMFKYEWIIRKSRGTTFANTDVMPLRVHETALVFAVESADYYPQMEAGEEYRTRKSGVGSMAGKKLINRNYALRDVNTRYPTSVLDIRSMRQQDVLHPTQKPVDLFRYLIRTYTRPGELVFDPCVGSGTTAVAAREEGRRYIVGDSSPDYCTIARNRLAQPYTPSFLPALDAAAS